MKRIIILFLIILITVPAFCREKSDIAAHKEFLNELINTMSTQPGKEKQNFVHVTELKSAQAAGARTTTRPVGNSQKSIKKFVLEKFDFSYQTPYGNFKVLVITTSNYSFDVSFSSEYPIQQYQLRDSATKNVTEHGELNDAMAYTFSVNRAFEPKYVLLLSMFKDGIISQNIIPLYKKANVKYLN